MIRQGEQVFSSTIIENICEKIEVDDIYVQRAALVQSKSKKVLFLQLNKITDHQTKKTIEKLILDKIHAFQLYDLKIKFNKKLPVDRRHFWKIQKEQLRKTII